MELKHCSHEHPLILYEAEKGDATFLDSCGLCRKEISGPAYKCSQQQCSFHLHKICAELPNQREHSVHLQHPLVLTRKSPNDSPSRECNLCGGRWDKFRYHCSQCKFDLCISCSLKEKSRFKDQQIHQHPLDLLQRPALFHCDACGMKSEEISYVCTACPFWIHKGCASLKKTIQIRDHIHSLTRNYLLRVEDHKFCNICKKEVSPKYWFYFCAICNYFTHLKCPQPMEEPKDLLHKIHSEIREKQYKLRVRFPAKPNNYVNLIRIFSQDFNSEEKESVIGVTELNHFHDHPLILSDEQSNKDVKIDEILCDGCVQPISDPFYSCPQCSFFLHECCAKLPKKVQHPFHSIHLLVLHKNDLDIFYYFRCNLCNIFCNGFSFKCADCNFSLDVKCASLYKAIFHEVHKHPLNRIRIRSPDCSCNACGETLHESAFGCFRCKDFHLSNHCTMLPPTVHHRYDPHQLYLSYPPFEDHPDEFYCEICEQKMDPNLWMYDCRKCDQSFHTRCIYPFDEIGNFKFGKTLKVDYHPHVLTVIGEAERQSGCDRCGQYFLYKYAFECGPCNTIVCLRCILSANS